MGEYVDIFGRDRLFVELQEHSIPELTEINKTLIEMAPRYDLRFLATNDVHYTRAEDADPHEVLLCIQTSSTVKDPKLTFSDKGYYLKSYAGDAQLFGEHSRRPAKQPAHRRDVRCQSRYQGLPSAAFRCARRLRRRKLICAICASRAWSGAMASRAGGKR